MREPRYAHVATRLDDGRVLVVGGSRSADERIPATGAPPEAPHFTLISDTSEIYDPVADRWTLVSETPAIRRVGHTVTKLDDGRVLVVGGFTHATFGGSTPFNLHAIPFATSSCALFDPASNRFAPAAPIEARGYHAATCGPNGEVFVSGGQFAEILGPSSPNTWISRGRASTFVYAAGVWSAGPPLPSARILHGQVALGNGRILIAGGAQVTTNFGPSSVFGDALLWDGGAQFLSTTPLPTARYRFAFATYPDGSPAAIGGFEAAATNIIPALAATLYTPAP